MIDQTASKSFSTVRHLSGAGLETVVFENGSGPSIGRSHRMPAMTMKIGRSNRA
jgi:hypothetical protein